MKDPELAYRIVKAVSCAISKPVTVKIRKGFNAENVNAVEFAKRMEDAGAAAIAVHGRTREEYYRGKADRDIIRQVKEAVKIPVLGNGDIKCGEDVERMYRETGCDGFLIGRGAQGNPWIFSQILEYFQTGEEPAKPTVNDMIDMMLRQARLMIEVKGEEVAIREMRKHAAWYTAGYKNSSHLRNAVNHVSTYAELEELFKVLKT
jgi:nifR3 family TIM-barrel protein